MVVEESVWKETEQRLERKGLSEVPQPKVTPTHIQIPDAQGRVKARLRNLGFKRLAESVSEEGIPKAALDLELATSDDIGPWRSSAFSGEMI
jgi:hypothetical protein